VDTVYADSTINKLNQAVLDVQSDKGKYSRMVDQFAAYWTPGVLIVALLIATIGKISRRFYRQT
jgi:cation transport ATPase